MRDAGIMRRTRTLTAIGSVALVVPAFVLAKQDATTVGTASMVALLLVPFVPFVGALLNATFSEKPRALDAIAPALVTSASVVGVSLAFGGWGFELALGRHSVGDPVRAGGLLGREARVVSTQPDQAAVATVAFVKRACREQMAPRVSIADSEAGVTRRAQLGRRCRVNVGRVGIRAQCMQSTR